MHKLATCPSPNVEVFSATLNGFESLKPYLEMILADKALKSIKEKPKVYQSLVEKKEGKLLKGRKAITQP